MINNRDIYRYSEIETEAIQLYNVLMETYIQIYFLLQSSTIYRFVEISHFFACFERSTLNDFFNETLY